MFLARQAVLAIGLDFHQGVTGVGPLLPDGDLFVWRTNLQPVARVGQ
jgi:hypothetical protein